MKFNNDCLYRKVGRKYEPIGVCEPVNYIPDGIWYVKSGKGSRGMTNVEYIGEMMKIGDKEDISIGVQCGIVDMAEEIVRCSEMRELMDKGCSMYDIVVLTLKRAYDMSLEKKEK